MKSNLPEENENKDLVARLDNTFEKTVDLSGRDEVKMKEETEDEDLIPVLRTFKDDLKLAAISKGDSELAKQIAADNERKTAEQQNLKRKAKELAREELLLREEIRDFSSKKPTEKMTKEEELEFIKNTIRNTSDKMKENVEKEKERIVDLQKNVNKLQKELKDTKNGDRVIASGVDEFAPKYKPLPNNFNSDAKILEEEVVTTPNKINIGADSNISNPLPQPATLKQKIPFFNVKEVTEEPQKTADILKFEEETIVKKEKLKKSWENLEQKKRNVVDRGLRVRDLQNYIEPAASAVIPGIRRRQTLIVTSILLFIIASFIVILLSVLTVDRTPNAVVSIDKVAETNDELIITEETNFVDLSTDFEKWTEAIKEQQTVSTIKKFVPYTIQGDSSTQLSIESLLARFNIIMPRSLINSFGNYYYIGNYTTNIQGHHIMLISIDNYSSALASMLAWEKNAPGEIGKLFPPAFDETTGINTTVQTRIIDNKDVKQILSETDSETLSYYFFSRNILVIIIGNPSVIPEINNRIRLANSS